MESDFILYVAVKLIGYCLWAGFGLVLLQRFSVGRAIKFGILRLMLGIGFGAAIFLFYHVDGGQNLLLPYLLIYAPVRWLEWSIINQAMHSGDRLFWSKDMRLNCWRLGGILVSFGIDFLSPEGMKGMFCVGRCLC